MLYMTVKNDGLCSVHRISPLEELSSMNWASLRIFLMIPCDNKIEHMEKVYPHLLLSEGKHVKN